MGVRTKDFSTSDSAYDATNMGVIRIRQNVLKESSVGIIASTGDPLGRENSWMSGADFTFQTTRFNGDKNFIAGAWALYTDREDITDDQSAFGFKIDYPNDKWDLAAIYSRIGEQFDPSLGFVPRKGVHYMRLGATYAPRPKEPWLRQMFHQLYGTYIRNLNGSWQSYSIFTAPINWRLESGDRVEFNIRPVGENILAPFEIAENVVIPENEYHFMRYRLEAEFAAKRRLNGQASWWFGSFYEGHLNELELQVNWNPNALLGFEFNGVRNTGKLPWGNFDQTLVGSRVRFNVNSDLQVNSYLQYDTITRFVIKSDYGKQTIKFSDKDAVKALNKALLWSDYSIKWDISDNNLCPPIPGRLDYLLYASELLGKKEIQLLDIGTGANLIYPILGVSHFNWDCTGTEVNSESIKHAEELIVKNPKLAAIQLRNQKFKNNILNGIINPNDYFDLVVYSRQLNNLEFDEREEIQRILNDLTNSIRPFSPFLAEYQEYLAHKDITAAKAKYANEMNAVLPKLSEERQMYLRDAYHPLLFLSNKLKREKTFPQTIELHPENRIIVISGPNAGGKSITLKTIGLLQVMLQSGFLVPVHERSKMCLFYKILTDIGDNQSIENHLSTYSYRLKNMNHFLRKCNKNTLFLIDEFGTGSDPELGGALAEAFLEVFYEREAYGVITTHYANLKALANELPHCTNANMLFNSKTLEPTFQLALGQAGSSFTFEVAQKNGIPYSLINKAKKKIERGKVRFDATIAKLQKERSKMAETGSKLHAEEVKAREEAQRLETLNSKIKSKLENYQELYDYNQRMIYLGNKKIAKKKAVVAEKNKPRPVFKLGDRVRLFDGKAVGTIDTLEKNKAIVNYGLFTTNVSIEKLELVEANNK
nr:EOG090X04JL [Artemia franciscana]